MSTYVIDERPISKKEKRKNAILFMIIFVGCFIALITLFILAVLF